jgi:type IV pilus modification protein PilV
MNRITDSDGFTLIEVLIAIIVLVIGLLGVVGVATTVISGNTLARELTTATTLAQDKIEELKSADYATITTGDDTQESIYTRTWTVTADSPVAGMKTISVAVSFSWKGTTHTVTLKTMVKE